MLAPKSQIIDSTLKDDILQIYPCDSLLSSDKMGWDGIHLGYYRLPPHSIPEHCSKQHLILIHPQIPSKMQVEQKIEGRFEKIQIKDGDIIIIPANTPHLACWDTEHSYIRLSLDPQKLARYTNSVDLDAVELMPCFQKPDPLILGIGLALKQELELEGNSDRLYIDSLTTTLSAHLLRHYSAQKLTIREYTNGLPKYRLRQVIEYINDHLDRSLTLAELAAIVQMSPNYFSSLFKQSTGVSPHQYVIRRRVERAKQLLVKGELTIAEITYSLGFAHQSHFNRHFKRLVGVTPKVFQKNQ